MQRTTPVNRNHTADDDAPTRTQQRREALAVLTLAGRLLELPLTQLAALALPEDVRREIDHARSITSHIARKRQLGFLAKVMRRHDTSVLDGARAALGENREHQRQTAAALQRLEAIREHLLADPDAALSQLIAQYSQLDRQHLRSLIRQALAERAAAKPPRAYREIFRLLRQLTEKPAADAEVP